MGYIKNVTIKFFPTQESLQSQPDWQKTMAERSNCDISVDLHERVNLITGVNGAGKSVILKVLSLMVGWKFHIEFNPIKILIQNIEDALKSEFKAVMGSLDLESNNNSIRHEIVLSTSNSDSGRLNITLSDAVNQPRIIGVYYNSSFGAITNFRKPPTSIRIFYRNFLITLMLLISLVVINVMLTSQAAQLNVKNEQILELQQYHKFSLLKGDETNKISNIINTLTNENRICALYVFSLIVLSVAALMCIGFLIMEMIDHRKKVPGNYYDRIGVYTTVLQETINEVFGTSRQNYYDTSNKVNLSIETVLKEFNKCLKFVFMDIYSEMTYSLQTNSIEYREKRTNDDDQDQFHPLSKSHITEVSDGYALITQLILRLSVQQCVYDSFVGLVDGRKLKEDPIFLVILDEPESHLHPRFQKKIFSRVVEYFTSAQFIIATQSPLILTVSETSKTFEVYSELIRESLPNTPEKNYYMRKVRHIAAMGKGGTTDEILRDVFGFDSTRPMWIERKIERYFEIFRTLGDESANDDEFLAIDNILVNMGLKHLRIDPNLEHKRSYS